MFNYLKWELKDYFGTKYKWFTVFGIIFLLFLIVPMDKGGFFSGQIAFGFIIIMTIAFFGSYFAGTKHAIETFRKKTFLLESMIPVSSKKILLTKYILGIIINFIYVMIFIIGFSILIFKGAGIEKAFEFFEKLIEYLEPAKLLEVSLFLICSTVSFLSVVVVCFVLAKVINPSNKHDRLLGFILAIIVIYNTAYFVSLIVDSSTSIYIIDLIYLVIATIAFYITSYLIDNKLEIYT